MNLIICTSPLQMLIAERIIKQYSREHFEFLLITDIINNKYLHYFNQLSGICNRSIIVKSYTLGIRGIYGYIFTIIKLKIKIRKKYTRIFLASIDSSLIHNILSFVKFTELYTFDDGTINISDNNVYKNSSNIITSRFYPILKRIFNINYSIDRIKKESIKHYTIYKSNNNIIKNIYYLELIDNHNVNLDSKVVSILLGQRVYESDYDNIELIKRVISKYNIKYSFPHPKETYFIDGVKYIETDLIFEDFIKNINSNIILYTFFSSAALNVSGIKYIEVISLKPGNLTDKRYLDCYRLFLQNDINVYDV